MNLYKISGIVTILMCIGILVFSYFSWQDKLQNAAGTNSMNIENTNTQSETINTETESTSDVFVNIDKLLVNMDEPVKELFLQKNTEGEILQLLIVGSTAMESGEPGYAERLKASLEKSYGDAIEVSIEALDGTSDTLQYIDLNSNYDLALLEPLTLMNNDRLSIEEEREDVIEFSDRMKAANADSLIILHPPQPIYGAGYYRSQVQALEEFANLYGFSYIDHWDAWPSTEDIALKEHLTEDAVPNDKGAETWATELTNYFISN